MPGQENDGIPEDPEWEVIERPHEDNTLYPDIGSDESEIDNIIEEEK